MQEDILSQPISLLAAQVKARKISPVELVELSLRRIRRLDEHLHAFITVAEETALKAARQAEASLAHGANVPPLFGIPFGVKDQMDAQGMPTTMSKDAGEPPATEDATVVARLKSAGGILIGKQALSFVPDAPFGEPKNPWDQSRHPGGSSGGPAISVAAGYVPFAIGEDTGGSIRAPASFNGLTGLRPTWGRISLHTVRPFVRSMDTLGPLTWSAEDCALVSQAIAGYDEKDPAT